MVKDGPVIIQSDTTLLLDTHAPLFEEARDALLPFASLEKSPEHVHTWSLSPLSLWNAAQAGMDAEAVCRVLEGYSRYEVPANVFRSIRDVMSRFGKVVMRADPHEDPAAPLSQARLTLRVPEKRVRLELRSDKRLMKYLVEEEEGFSLKLMDRGSVKLELMRALYPCRDEAPLVQGASLPLALRTATKSGNEFALRAYQKEAVRSFIGDKAPGSGYGTIVLPCGSGKTVIGMGVMAELSVNVLILTANSQAVSQWKSELADKTDIDPSLVGEYSGERKEIKPITVATYQILIWRPAKDAEYPHFSLFRARPWGLIVYDEVHLLPAPVFRVTAELQAVRRLGLTATLVREDGREGEVALVGPKRYDVPWKELEAKGWIAQAFCREIRVALSDERSLEYAVAEKRAKVRLAGENPLKIAVVDELIHHHSGEGILVIGEYLSQLDAIAAHLQAPLITGKTPSSERIVLYDRFRSGEIRLLVVSRVANFAIDLPDASVAIQVSGAFGSRQEEAQRLGRILRPKRRNSYFYTLVSEMTVEEEFSANRQKFLAEQGYRYEIERRDPSRELPAEAGSSRGAEAREALRPGDGEEA
jgi:DNA excision repair protein ERCC-3